MRGRILDAVSWRGLGDVRVFSSVARDEAGQAGDVDLLVAPGPRIILSDLSGFGLAPSRRSSAGTSTWPPRAA
jgi:predicted nucleotidyltransferase